LLACVVVVSNLGIDCLENLCLKMSSRTANPDHSHLSFCRVFHDRRPDVLWGWCQASFTACWRARHAGCPRLQVNINLGCNCRLGISVGVFHTCYFSDYPQRKTSKNHTYTYTQTVLMAVFWYMWVSWFPGTFIFIQICPKPVHFQNFPCPLWHSSTKSFSFWFRSSSTILQCQLLSLSSSYLACPSHLSLPS